MEVSVVHKFMILLWKNFTLKKRQFIAIATEIFITFILGSTVWLVRTASDIRTYGPFIYGSFSHDTLPYNFPRSSSLGNWQLAFVPSTSQVVSNIIENVKSDLQYDFDVKGFASEKSFERYIHDEENYEKVLAAIIFDHEFKNTSDPLPQEVKCYLRFSSFQRNVNMGFIRIGGWKTDSLYPEYSQPGPRHALSSDGGSPGYFSEGFLAVQHALANSITRYHASQHPDALFTKTKINVISQRFPYKRYNHDYFFAYATIFIPLIVLFIFSINYLILVKSIVWEKQNRLKEYQLMIGLSNWMLWAAYFVTFLIVYLINIILICIIFFFKVDPKPIFLYSDASLVFVFLLCFAFATIFFSFMISTFFSKVYFAVSIGGFFYIAFYFPTPLVTEKLTELSVFQTLLFCLSSNVAMAVGARFIVKSEKEEIGIRWSNLFEPLRSEKFHFGYVLGMLLFDGFLYGLVTWYIEAVFPGEYGMPKPWYFFVQPSYWCGKNPKKCTQRKEFEDIAKTQFFEDEPTNLTAGIQIKNLWKEYPMRNTTKIAVKNLNLNLYEGQITVLLGSNGAGKSSTLSILSGLYPATYGEVYINGYNVSEEIVEIRKSLGLCPQQNLLFNHLTVSEQLYFYCVLKGVPGNIRSTEIDQMLTTFHLLEKRNVYSSLLTGGMKRKVSIIIALIGGSKVVILDEPTSGMDPASRRSTWDLLNHYKQNRTILLTTHYMDEADALGDRIAIMVHGSLKCCGSSIFLKNIYGEGYHLVMVKESHCNVEDICDLIYDEIPTATLENNTRNELSFILPKEYIHRYEDLFTALENRKEELGIAGFGAYITTMEEVFLSANRREKLEIVAKVTPSQAPYMMSQVSIKHESRIMSRIEMPNISSMNESPATKFNTGCSLYCQQFVAMFFKKVLFNWRNWKLLVIQMVAVLGCPIFLLEAERLSSQSVDVDARELNLKEYGQTIVPLSLSGSFDFNIFIKAFETVLQLNNQKLVLVKDNLQRYLVENKDCIYTCITAVDINGNDTAIQVTSLFNNDAIHSPAVSLGLIENVFLLMTSNASLRLFNKPQPYIDKKANKGMTSGLHATLYIHFGLALLMSGFCLLSVTERLSNAKHIQFMTGLSVLVYWLSSLLWDIIIFIFICCWLMVVLRYFHLVVYTSNYRFLDTMLIFIIYGWSSIPLMYLMGFLYNRTGNAYAMLAVFNYISGIFTTLVDHVFQSDIQRGISNSTKNFILKGLIIFPNFNLGKCLRNYFDFYHNRLLCSVKHPPDHLNCKELSEDYFIYSLKEKMIGRYLMRMILTGFICLILIIFLETTLWRIKTFFNQNIAFSLYKIFRQKNMSQELYTETEDEDVQNERIKIMTMTPESLNSTVLIKELIKIYFKYPLVIAAKNISLEIQKGECFGVVGYTGAGKTTLFKILTEEETVTSGDVFIDGSNITKNTKRVKSKVGYCPQFDALLDYMTAREILIMYARLWGIPEHSISEHVTRSLCSLQLETHADKIIKTYSGGNKRRLSTAIAMMGNPSVILMDEPSTCMDPLARHLLWNVVTQARESGKVIVISSHSMEECDAICTKLAILVQGKIVCLGSPQHLKNKFGNIYIVKVKVKSEAREQKMNEFKIFIETEFPGSELKQETQGIVNYYIPSKDISWGKIFGILEEAKDQYHLEDYSISQMTLEQIFLIFAVPETPEEKRKLSV